MRFVVRLQRRLVSRIVSCNFTVAVRRRAATAWLLAGAASFALRGVSSAEPCNVIAEFDVAPRGDLICLPLRINTRAFPFALGTGCTYWIFDTSLRRELTELDPAKGRAAASDGTPLFMVPVSSFAGFPIGRDATAGCAAFHDNLLPAGQDLYGVAGCQFLKDKVVSIDFDRGKVAFLRHAGTEFGERFNLDLLDLGDGVRPFLLVGLPGGQERFLINTSQCSFTAGTIAKERFNKLCREASMSPLVCDEATAFNLDRGEIAVLHARLPILRLGKFRHEGLVFNTADSSELGLGYLSRYVVTIDFQKRSMYLRPGKQYGRMEQYGRGGITIARWEGKTIAANVRKGSPAEAAGLAFMDEIISVDHALAEKTSIFELCRLFARPGRREVVVMRRGQETHTAVIMTD